jgi:hypothetical protein
MREFYYDWFSTGAVPPLSAGVFRRFVVHTEQRCQLCLDAPSWAHLSISLAKSGAERQRLVPPQ